MSSAFPVIGTPSAGPNNFIQTWTTDLPSESLDLVILTSIQTETIYPTWIYTISDSAPSTSSIATTVLDLVPSTLSPTPETVTLTATNISTTKPSDTIASTTPTVASESSFPTSSSSTTPLSSPIKEVPIPTSAETFTDLLQYSGAPSSLWTPIPSTSSSTASLPELPALPGAVTSSVSSVSASTSTSTVPSNTPSMSPSIIGTTSASSSDTPQADQSRPMSTSKIGTIVGSIIGGSAFTVFALLACAILIRRRRHRSSTERFIVTQKLLRGDSLGSSTGHCRYPSYPSIPGNISPRSPKLPVIPVHQHSNPDLSLDSMYLRGERTAENPFADPPSAVIEVSVPSRSVSIYSSSSWGNVHRSPGWDCEREGAGSLAVPRSSSGYLDTPMMRDSMRSDPFDLDLEPPPNVHHRPPVPPLPTPWGVKF